MDSYAVGQQEIAFDMNGMHNGSSNGGYDQFGGDSPPHEYGYWQNDDMMAGADGPDDGSDPKLRRRIQRACDMCRKKKIKCDGGTPSCKNCINYKTECIFTPMEKKRNPPKGAKYIEALENRLGTMEKVLRLSGILGDDDDKIDLAAIEARFKKTGTSVTTGTDNLKQPDDATKSSQPNAGATGEEGADKPAAKSDDAAEPTVKAETEVERLSDLMCSLVTNNLGETRFFGSSSGFSIFSPTGIKWVSSKLGDDSFQKCLGNMEVEENNWFYWKPEIFGDIFRKQVYTPLPPLPECLSLLKDFFDNFNLIFPLFHEPTFMHLVRRHYSQDPYEGSGWWASLNVALAIAHRLRVMSSVASSEDDVKGWAFLKNALAVLPELTMRNTDLLSIQAIIGMALFLHGTPSPQASFFLIAAALRLAHSIGLHKRGSGFNLNPIEMEQRRRVFWIAYMCDKDISLRSGRPPAQDDDDMNVDLPSEDPEDFVGNIPLADGKGKINLFRLMCRFAIIQSNVYKKLYATKASKQSDGELLNIIGELDKELEDWKDSIPIDYRPDHEIKATHTPLIIHVVVLHFAYYNCLTTIHRMSVDHGFWTSRLANYAVQGLNARPLNPRVFSSAAYCVQAARSSIQLLKYIPQGDYACVWMIIYYPVTSLVALFANLLQNSQDVRGRSDLKLMQSVVNFLQMLIAGEGTGSVKRMFNVCFEFTRIAKIVLDKNDKDSTKKRKKSEHEAETPPASVAPSLRPSVKDSNEPESQVHSSRQTPLETPSKESRVPSAGTDSSRALPNPSTQANPAAQIPTTNQPEMPAALPQQNLQFNADLLQQGFDPSMNFSMSSPATQNSNPPMASGMHMHSFLPGPGDFPNTYTDFSDMEQFGNVSQNIANYAQQYMTPDMWATLQIPEALSVQANSPVPGMGMVDMGYNPAMAGMQQQYGHPQGQPGMGLAPNMHLHPEQSREQHHQQQHLRQGHPRGNLGHGWGT